MKTKLKLCKEVVIKLSASTKVRGGDLETRRECMEQTNNTKATRCMDTFYSKCNCAADTQYGCLEPGGPGMTGNCMASHHCSYPCQSQGYADCI